MQLDAVLSSYSLISVFYGGIVILILVFISLGIKKPSPFLKKILFICILSVVVSVTIFLAGSTIYLNAVSLSRGPVHYHADFEIWNCNQEIDPKNPKGISNKIGTATLHEHNDKRIHLEGVVMDDKSASLGRFFEVIGGKLTSSFLLVPTNEGQVNLASDTVCPNGQTATLQVFVYKTVYGNYYQQKVMDPQNYIISPQTNVPPGDCIIVEFDSPKNKTDKICRSFRIAEEIGKLKGEIEYGN